MNTSKHTPGPWIYDGGSSIKSPSTDIEVVSLYGAMGGDNNKADAYMLSAAPAMYEALRDIVNALHFHPSRIDMELNKARQALAQAEGK